VKRPQTRTRKLAIRWIFPSEVSDQCGLCDRKPVGFAKGGWQVCSDDDEQPRRVCDQCVKFWAMELLDGLSAVQLARYMVLQGLDLEGGRRPRKKSG
jgi:hypothetical protein